MKRIMQILFFVTLLLSSIYADTMNIRVTKSTEIYKSVNVKVSKTYYEEVEVSVPYSCGHEERNSIGLDTIIGSTIGIIIGNQVGAGNGRTAAKIVGGISGGYIANQQRGSNTCYRTEYRQKPITRYEDDVRERLVGYRNCGYIGHKEICKRSRYKLHYISLSY